MGGIRWLQRANYVNAILKFSLGPMKSTFDDIRGNSFGQVVHQLLEDELVLSEELVLSDTFEHRPQCQRIEFYIEIRGSAADQDSDAKVIFFQGSSTFLHDTTRKNGNLQAFRRFLRLRFLHRSLCQLGLLLGLGKQARALDNHLAHPQSKHS